MSYYHRRKSILLFHKQEKQCVFVTWKLGIYYFKNSSKCFLNCLIRYVRATQGFRVHRTVLTNALWSLLWKIFQTKENTYIWYNMQGQIYLHFISTLTPTFHFQMLLQSIWKTRSIIFKGVEFQRNKGLLVVKEREKKQFGIHYITGI